MKFVFFVGDKENRAGRKNSFIRTILLINFWSTDETDDTDFMHRSRSHSHPEVSTRRSRQLRAKPCSLSVLCDSACEKHVSVKFVPFVGDKENRDENKQPA